MTVIFHITTSNEWKEAQSTGIYRGDTLETQGFIHRSTPKQIVRVANALYRGRKGLVLLCIDSEKLESKIRFDKLASGESYPHIYGPINREAVVRTLPFEPNVDGSFSLQGGLGD